MYRILIIEDEPAYQKILKNTFQKAKFEVILASEGKQGIIEASKTKPDFILLDLIMPGMNGITVLRHIKEISGLEKVPLAILTVVPDGVPQSLHGQDIFRNVVGYWIKDKLTPKKIVRLVKEYLTNPSDSNRVTA